MHTYVPSYILAEKILEKVPKSDCEKFLNNRDEQRLTALLVAARAKRQDLVKVRDIVNIKV